MRRRMTVFLAASLIAVLCVVSLCSTALAGEFVDNGKVDPTTGDEEDTFTWDVWYILAEEQETPSCYLKIYDGEWQIGSYMMAATTIFGQVHYEYSRTLPSGTNYSFKMQTFDDSTLVQFGPTVY